MEIARESGTRLRTLQRPERRRRERPEKRRDRTKTSELPEVSSPCSGSSLAHVWLELWDVTKRHRRNTGEPGHRHRLHAVWIEAAAAREKAAFPFARTGRPNELPFLVLVGCWDAGAVPPYEVWWREAPLRLTPTHLDGRSLNRRDSKPDSFSTFFLWPNHHAGH